MTDEGYCQPPVGDLRRLPSLVLVTAFLILTGVQCAQAVILKDGDLLVTDSEADAVVRVDPQTGEQTIVSSGGYLTTPGGIAVSKNGAVYVAVQRDSVASTPAGVIRVDPKTGSQAIVSSGGIFESLRGLVLDATGNILVTQGDSTVNAIIHVDVTTGAQTIVSSGGMFVDPTGLARESSGSLLVVDQQAQAVIRVDPGTGGQALVSTGGQLLFPTGLSLEEDGHAVVADEPANALLRVDPSDGTQTAIASADLLDHPFGVAVERGGTLVVANGTAAGGIVRVDPASGDQTLVSSGGFFQRPGWVAIVPPISDLRVSGALIWPLFIRTAPGGTFTMFDVVKNQGAVASGASIVRYTLSLDKVPSAGDVSLDGSRNVPVLPPGSVSGGNATVTIPAGTAPGRYVVVACADGNHSVAERDEGNNCFAALGAVFVVGHLEGQGSELSAQ